MKFGKRLLTELPPQLAPFALDYAALKKLIKDQAGLPDTGTGLESGESSMAESAGELNSLEDALAAGPSPLRDTATPATPQQASAFSSALRDGLVRPAEHAEAAAAQISAALMELPQRAGPDEDERLQPLLDGVEELHAFVVLNYIGLFKLVKKYNKAMRVAPGGPSAVAALPLLLASPLFHSRPLQLLFQRTAKWRHEGSQHGGNAAAAAAAAAQERFGGVASPVKGGGVAASSAPLSPLKLRAGVPIFGARASSGGLAGFAEAFGSSGSLSGEGGSAHGGSSAGAVRCEGCVRAHTRFVVLGCCHTFCWGCLAATLVRQRKLTERQASGSALAALGLHASPATAAAVPAPTQPPPPPMAPLPPNAGLLARRLSAESGGGWARAPCSPSFAAADGPRLECPVCDAFADLETGHLEVNAMLGDASYVWLLTPADGERRNRRILSRSRLAGMDFASLSVYGSVGSGSPALGPLGPLRSRDSGGALSSLGGAAEADSPGGAAATAPAGPGQWPKMGRVPSWGSLNVALGGSAGGARQS